MINAIWKSGSFTAGGSLLGTATVQLSNYNTLIGNLWFTNPTTAAIAMVVTDANGAVLVPGTAVVALGRFCLENVYAAGGVVITAAQDGLWIGGCWEPVG